MIQRETIEDMFNHIRATVDAPFDIDGECLWTYFLYDADPKVLEEVGESLVQEGFTFDGLLRTSCYEEPSPRKNLPPVISNQIDWKLTD